MALRRWLRQRHQHSPSAAVHLNRMAAATVAAVPATPARLRSCSRSRSCSCRPRWRRLAHPWRPTVSLRCCCLASARLPSRNPAPPPAPSSHLSHRSVAARPAHSPGAAATADAAGAGCSAAPRWRCQRRLAARHQRCWPCRWRPRPHHHLRLRSTRLRLRLARHAAAHAVPQPICSHSNSSTAGSPRQISHPADSFVASGQRRHSILRY